MSPWSRILAAAGAAAALAAPGESPAQEVLAYAEGRPVVDYDAWKAAVPEMREISKRTMEFVKELHECMERLSAAESDAAKQAEERLKARDLLLKYRQDKAALVRLVDRCLATPPAAETDLQIRQRLRDTELVGVTWSKTKYIDCLRDLARELRLRIVLHPDVLKFNTVEATFPKTSADGILRQMTFGFDCEYILHNGEVVIIKAIKRNDKRLEQYREQHPDWKYWRPKEAPEIEDDLSFGPGPAPAPGGVPPFALVLREALRAAAAPPPAAPAPAEGGPAAIEEMDMGLLQRNLLKIYVCEKESAINEKRLEELKVEVESEEAGVKSATAAEQQRDSEERHKHIFHYLLLEKTSAVQVIHIADRVLGTDVHLTGEGKAHRAILEKAIDLIEIPPKTEIHEAAKILSKALGCNVRVESIEEKIYRLSLSMGPTTGEAVLKHISSSLPFDYRFEEGGIVLRNRLLGRKREDLKEIEEEERRAREEEEKGKK